MLNGKLHNLQQQQLINTAAESQTALREPKHLPTEELFKSTWDRVTSRSDSCVSNNGLCIVHISIVFCFKSPISRAGSSTHPEGNDGFRVNP